MKQKQIMTYINCHRKRVTQTLTWIHNIHVRDLYLQRVMKRIVKRYIFDVQREDDASEGM
jgi:hypothetical protein